MHRYASKTLLPIAEEVSMNKNCFYNPAKPDKCLYAGLIYAKSVDKSATDTNGFFMKKQFLILGAVVLTCFSIVVPGCNNPQTLKDPQMSGEGVALLKITAVAYSPFEIIAAGAILTISAPDMLTMTKDLIVTDSSVQGVVNGIAAGKHRLFQVSVYDSLETIQYRGSAYSDVIADSIVLVSLSIFRVGGEAIINGTINEIGPDSSRCVDTSQGLIAYYPFNGNAADESDHGLNGQVYRATLTTDRLGNPNKAYSFDGSDTIGVPTSPLLNFGTKDFSICFWIKAQFGDDYIVMGKSNGGIPNFLFSSTLSCPGWNIQVENTEEYGWGIRLDMWDGSHGRYNIASSLSAIDDTWHFVVFTVSRNSTAKLYVDNVKKDEQSVIGIGSLDNNEPFRIGKRPDWPSFFKGSLDQIRLFNRVITEPEIARLYKETM